MNVGIVSTVGEDGMVTATTKFTQGTDPCSKGTACTDGDGEPRGVAFSGEVLTLGVDSNGAIVITPVELVLSMKLPFSVFARSAELW